MRPFGTRVGNCILYVDRGPAISALGLKEGSERIDLSGGVGFVRESKVSGPVVSALSIGVAALRGM